MAGGLRGDVSERCPIVELRDVVRQFWEVDVLRMGRIRCGDLASEIGGVEQE